MVDRYRYFIFIGWIVAIIATIGSLYYSLIAGFYPCRLCWYQRILMYPLVLILGYSFVTNQPKIYKLILVFGILGLSISIYHSFLQITSSDTCTFVGCGNIQFKFLGILTIPNQAGLGFILIILSMIAIWFQLSQTSTSDEIEDKVRQ